MLIVIDPAALKLVLVAGAGDAMGLLVPHVLLTQEVFQELTNGEQTLSVHWWMTHLPDWVEVSPSPVGTPLDELQCLWDGDAYEPLAQQMDIGGSTLLLHPSDPIKARLGMPYMDAFDVVRCGAVRGVLNFEAGMSVLAAELGDDADERVAKERTKFERPLVSHRTPRRALSKQERSLDDGKEL